jgi:RNA polymerase sigma-70 factor (ECF subfamily)
MSPIMPDVVAVARNGRPAIDRMTDELTDIIVRIGKGDRTALQDLHEQASQVMFGILMKYFRRRADAEEALHDVLVKIWRVAPRFDPERKGMPWLVTVTRNHAIDVLRSNREYQFEDGELDRIVDLSTAKGKDTTLTGMAVAKCLQRLQPKFARLILEVYVWGYTYEEAAERFDAPIGTIRTWVRRSMLTLRDCMGEK